ncbi:MAG: hypothetical protein IAF38_16745 [Bacteroidia bacterium]|nr:hypothetical protein [Bacteroidia bacterium]
MQGQLLPYNLKGKVKQLTGTEYIVEQIKDNEVKHGKQSDLQYIYFLGPFNKLIKIVRKELDGTFYSETRYTYNSYGLLVQEKTKNKYNETSSMQFFYNDKKQLAEEKRFRNEESEACYKYIYANNRKIKTDNYNHENKLISSHEYEYDAKGNHVKTRWLSTMGGEETELFCYDSLNRRTSYDLFGSSKYTCSYTDTSSLISTESFFKNGTLEWTKTYLYDSHRRQKRIEFTDHIKKLTRLSEYKCKYDSAGNLTEEVYIENGEAKYVRVYKIRYK